MNRIATHGKGTTRRKDTESSTTRDRRGVV
jgi:hypothetical protein